MPEDDEVVIIRDVLPEDLPILFEYQRQPPARRRFPGQGLGHVRGSLGEDLEGQKAITRAVVQGNWPRQHQELGAGRAPRINCWIRMEHWGRCLPRRRYQPSLRRVETAPSTRTWRRAQLLASLRVLQKCGFTIVERPRIRPGGRRCRGARDEAGVM